jgi:hypothetical protein
MPQYAARTRVPIEKTKTDIERLVKRYGAKGFVSGWQGDAARIEFIAHNRHIRFSVLVPLSEQAARQIVGDIVMPDGRTVWESTREPIKLAYDGGKPLALLGA